jgi:hypothetical protein
MEGGSVVMSRQNQRRNRSVSPEKENQAVSRHGTLRLDGEHGPLLVPVPKQGPVHESAGIAGHLRPRGGRHVIVIKSSTDLVAFCGTTACHRNSCSHVAACELRPESSSLR